MCKKHNIDPEDVLPDSWMDMYKNKLFMPQKEAQKMLQEQMGQNQGEMGQMSDNIAGGQFETNTAQSVAPRANVEAGKESEVGRISANLGGL